VPSAALYKGVDFVDSEHDIFIQGIQQEKKLEVKFFCRKRQREVVSICAPLHYSHGSPKATKNAENEMGCYYLWDFGAENDNNFLALSSSEIIQIKLTDEVFSIQEFFSISNQE